MLFFTDLKINDLTNYERGGKKKDFFTRNSHIQTDPYSHTNIRLHTVTYISIRESYKGGSNPETQQPYDAIPKQLFTQQLWQNMADVSSTAELVAFCYSSTL